MNKKQDVLQNYSIHANRLLLIWFDLKERNKACYVRTIFGRWIRIDILQWFTEGRVQITTQYIWISNLARLFTKTGSNMMILDKQADIQLCYYYTTHLHFVILWKSPRPLLELLFSHSKWIKIMQIFYTDRH